MAISFITPAISSISKLGVSLFDETDPIELRPGFSTAEVDVVIRAVYRQVLGNTYVMESEQLLGAESRLRQGNISIREFVRQVAKSELYYSRFFTNCPRNRAIELNFKHLLGRAPESYEELLEHTQLLDRAGYEAEIDSYLDCDEYQTAFGENRVPYYRGYKTQPGKKAVGFTHIFRLLRGGPGSDKDVTLGNQSRLNQSIMANVPSTIVPTSHGCSYGWTVSELDQSSLKKRYQAFEDFEPFELWPGSSEEEAETIIRAVYRQVLGNIHVMESERLVVPESQLKRGVIGVREFVRQVAKSELYRSRFFENCPRYRAIELNFKHLLGRAPESYEEMVAHSNILDAEGYGAEIDSYIDGDEYQDVFGENVVPFYRGYKSQTGKRLFGFTNMLQILGGAANSDKDGSLTRRSLLNRSLITDTVDGQGGPRTPLPIPKIVRSTWQQQYQAFEDFAPFELWPGSSEEEVATVVRAVYRQVLGNAHVMESERLVVPESQLRRGEISVREFVRQVAKSDLYRSRFLETCYRYRTIELNFKHLLGRAPESFEEMKQQSRVWDEGGFEAEIDSYLDSDEYQNAFGEDTVPFYRGYKTQTGKNMAGFNNMFALLRSASTSDKASSPENRPVLDRALISNMPYGKKAPAYTDVDKLLAEVFAPKSWLVPVVQPAVEAPSEEYLALQQQCKEQEEVLETLRRQLAEFQPFAALATAKTSQWQASETVTNGSNGFGGTAQGQPDEDSYEALQQRSQAQAQEIETLREKVADARRLALVGEARLSRWRSRGVR